MEEQKHCLVCGEPARRIPYLGYYFCNAHKWLEQFDPEELEMVVILRLKGKTSKQIERYYKGKYSQ